MANMTLGGYTFPHNPSSLRDIIQKRRDISITPTYSSVAIFKWPALYEGQILELNWDFMQTDMFETIRGFRDAGTTLVFNPQDGTGVTFNVEVVDISGQYHIHLANATGNHRKKVKLELVIVGVI
jgi:hypothetical protein